MSNTTIPTLISTANAIRLRKAWATTVGIQVGDILSVSENPVLGSSLSFCDAYLRTALPLFPFGEFPLYDPAALVEVR
jgi:hypothetical protein